MLPQIGRRPKSDLRDQRFFCDAFADQPPPLSWSAATPGSHGSQSALQSAGSIRPDSENSS
ncbi:MAG TPA: hypothetical protein DF774_07985 [Rheinheimera sp.]|nr:hypothetical protein [Rheinheimera sp.]